MTKPEDWPPEFMPCVEAFLAGDAARPRGLDSYPELYGTSLFFPLQRRRELEAMVRIARTVDPIVYLEVGADKGSGFYHLVKSLATVRRAIASEFRGLPWLPAMEKAIPDVEFLGLPGSSRDGKNLVDLELFLYGDTIDVLFIDGCKNSFLADFDAYLPFMSPDGIVFMHDIQELPGVHCRRDYDAACRRGYRHEEIIDTSEAVEAMDREKRGLPPASAHEWWLRHWRGRSCGVGVIYLDGKKA